MIFVITMPFVKSLVYVIAKRDKWILYSENRILGVKNENQPYEKLRHPPMERSASLAQPESVNAIDVDQGDRLQGSATGVCGEQHGSLSVLSFLLQLYAGSFFVARDASDGKQADGSYLDLARVTDTRLLVRY